MVQNMIHPNVSFLYRYCQHVPILHNLFPFLICAILFCFPSPFSFMEFCTWFRFQNSSCGDQAKPILQKTAEILLARQRMEQIISKEPTNTKSSNSSFWDLSIYFLVSFWLVLLSKPFWLSISCLH